MTCSYETREVTGAGDWLAHNPEVAGSNPVPATKESGPDQAKRPPASAGGHLFGERCERNGGRGCSPVAGFAAPSACDRWLLTEWPPRGFTLQSPSSEVATRLFADAAGADGGAVFAHRWVR